MPDSPDVSWSGYGFGPYCWCILTVLNLQRAGYECELSSELPDEGIVLTHRECCTFDGARLSPARGRLLINIAGDSALYPAANLQVVQNPTQAFWYKNCHYIPLWPEPGQKPRVPSARFRNISFIGALSQFQPELGQEEWTRELRKLGFDWSPRIESFYYDDPTCYRIGPGKWSDLTEIDAVVAVRQFTSYPTFDHKPPTKLINCWLTGVPAILGAESGYRSLYRSELDYIEVHSKEEVIEALLRLRNSPELRSAIIENGFKRAQEVSAGATVQRWINFLEAVAIPSYYCWTLLSEAAQHLSILDSRVSGFINRVRRKLSIRTSPPNAINNPAAAQ